MNADMSSTMSGLLQKSFSINPCLLPLTSYLLPLISHSSFLTSLFNRFMNGNDRNHFRQNRNDQQD